MLYIAHRDLLLGSCEIIGSKQGHGPKISLINMVMIFRGEKSLKFTADIEALFA